MDTSCSNWSDNVKQRNKKLKEQLLDLLKHDVKEIVLGGVDNYVVCGTQMLLELLMDAEARQLCGRRYSRDNDREHVRWGKEDGTAIVDGAKRGIKRPRVRLLRNMNVVGGEVQLESYKAMNRGELLDGQLVAKILAGVSSRKYTDLVSHELKAKGISKSMVSKRAIAATKPMVDEFLKKDLSHLDLVALLFDGIHIAKKQTVVCIGIDSGGHKHVLGMRVGATENEIVVRDLIRDLIDRGVSSEKQYLFVVDGSKALIQAIRAAFGQEVAVQRCQEHKIRDVQAYVPVKRRGEFRKKLQAAYNETTAKKALDRLCQVRTELGTISDGAVNALTEGMLETLTIHRLGITGLLRKSLRTTNIMESAFASVRRYMGRVTRFKDEAQIQMWVVRSLVEAERHFRGVPGYRQVRRLRSKLAEYKPWQSDLV
jgi:putative transposase